MIGERLRDLRNSKGLTTRKLEEISGISNVMITRYETGKTIPTKKVLDRLAKHLGVSADAINDPDTGAGSGDLSFNQTEFDIKLKKVRSLGVKDKAALSRVFDAFLNKGS